MITFKQNGRAEGPAQTKNGSKHPPLELFTWLWAFHFYTGL